MMNKYLLTYLLSIYVQHGDACVRRWKTLFSRAFYLGFHSVCASNALIMLRPEEVEQLVCGCPTLDLVELRKVTYYDGFKQEDITIQFFWEVKDEHILTVGHSWSYIKLTLSIQCRYFFSKKQFNSIIFLELNFLNQKTMKLCHVDSFCEFSDNFSFLYQFYF